LKNVLGAQRIVHFNNLAPVISTYNNMMNEVSESPTVYHTTTIIHTISAIMGRHFNIKQGSDTIYPNLYSIIVAPSSEYKKTSSIKQFQSMLTDIDWLQYFVGSMGSPSGLLDHLTDDRYKTATAYLYYSEFGEMLQSMKQTYMAGGQDILNDLFDCPEVYAKKFKKEPYYVKKPCVSIMAATQLASLELCINELVLLSGLLPRFFMCFSLDLKEPIIWRENIDEEKKAQVAGFLLNLRNFIESREESNPETCSISLSLTEDARNKFIHWGNINRNFIKDKPDHIKTMLGRIETLALKLSLIFHTAQGRWETDIIELDTIECAIEWAEFHRNSYINLVGSRLSFNKFSKCINKVIEMLDIKPLLTASELSRALHIYVHEVKNIMLTLEGQGIVSKEESEHGGTTYTKVNN
jgi:hypothetical protein